MIKYEKVTDLDLNGIAKAMIDGEVFFSENGVASYSWSGGGFVVVGIAKPECTLVGRGYYRKAELTPMQRAKEACEYFIRSSRISGSTEVEDFYLGDDAPEWDGDYIEMCRTIVNAYDGKGE